MFLGADVDELELAAERLDRVAQQADVIGERLHQQVRAPVHFGPYADGYYQRLSTVTIPAVAATAAGLRERAVELRTQAAQQRRVSDGRAGSVAAQQTAALPPNGYVRARDTFLGTAPPGTVRATYRTGAVDPRDPSVILIRLFIPAASVSIPGGGVARIVGVEPTLMGDNRGFTSDPSASSRVVVAWRPADGTVTFTVSDSHSPTATYPPLPIDGDNFRVWRDRHGDLGFTYHATNSVNPRTSPAIDGDVRVWVDGAHVGLQMDSDNFPAMEAYRYWPDGTVQVIGSHAKDDTFGPLALMPPDNDRQSGWVDGQPRSRPTESVYMGRDRWGQPLYQTQTIPVRRR